MTKLALESKLPPSPQGNPYLDSEQPIFFHHIMKCAGLTRKEIQYDLRVSKTLVDGWLNGNKIDPLTRARDVVDRIRQEHRADLIPDVLAYIAGAGDCTVLTVEQTAALKVLAKAVEGKPDA